MSVVRYSADAKADALHSVHALQGQGYARRAAVRQVAAQLGCRSETLNAWLRRDAARQRGAHPGSHDARIQRLERELYQLMRVNADLRAELEALEHRARDLALRTPAGAIRPSRRRS
ncbi:hypothetical protein [Pseudoxanthomonas sp.]|uniref:hypothetical protein n=1 Tax=Pseudoxanthomonas sp. TaxID=1871049 RepID=UPI002638EE4D|nr:hypothetical protein [Pseudoxanthomonas sp.]WDS34599.1 MAG: hypothetical protein O8I58_09310 [Pseudoxanthomonas sp.]